MINWYNIYKIVITLLQIPLVHRSGVFKKEPVVCLSHLKMINLIQLLDEIRAVLLFISQFTFLRSQRKKKKEYRQRLHYFVKPSKIWNWFNLFYWHFLVVLVFSTFKRYKILDSMLHGLFYVQWVRVGWNKFIKNSGLSFLEKLSNTLTFIFYCGFSGSKFMCTGWAKNKLRPFLQPIFHFIFEFCIDL